MEIETRYKEANKLLLELRDQLEQLESESDPTASPSNQAQPSIFLQGRISANLTELSRQIETLNALLPSQTTHRKEVWKVRVKQLSEECKVIKNSFGTFLDEKFKKSKQEQERAQLLERRSKNTNQWNTRAEALYQEGEALERVIKNTQDIEAAGHSISKSIFGQNEQLKNMRKKVYDMGVTLGLSTSIMRVIQRRQSVDQLILYGGMLLTLLVIFGLYYYVR